MSINIEVDYRVRKLLTNNEKQNIILPHEVEKKYLKWNAEAFKKWKKHFKIYKEFTLLSFKGKNKCGFVGQYMTGNYKKPVIFVYLDEIRLDSNVVDDGESLEANFKITIYHELGHALCEYQRKAGIELVSKRREETFVEQLARTIHYNRILPIEGRLIDDVLCLWEHNKAKELKELKARKKASSNINDLYFYHRDGHAETCI